MIKLVTTDIVVDYKGIRQKIRDAADLTIKGMRPRFMSAKQEAFSDWLAYSFYSHPVTQEIEQGESGSNITGALGGYGNLFSFIGFSKGEDPIDPIVTYLQSEISKGIRIKHQRNSDLWQIEYTVPTLAGVASVSPMPWAPGRSWVTGIEKGISGLGRYMYSSRAELYGSNSGTAIQATKSLLGGFRSQGKYTPQSYMSAILKLLTEEIAFKMGQEFEGLI